MLDETLVVWTGEMGRTPRVGPVGRRRRRGRARRPRPLAARASPRVLAGGGIKGGVVHGSSDRYAAYPATNPVSPPTWRRRSTTASASTRRRPSATGSNRPLAALRRRADPGASCRMGADRRLRRSASPRGQTESAPVSLLAITGLPILLTGAALVGLPVLLHLIMRQEPRRLPFPAFRFLKQRRQINQRKIRLRHLLLLLLRMGLIALICLSLWQPTVLSDGFSLRGGRPVAAVIVLDTSPSMGYVLADRYRADRGPAAGAEAPRRAGPGPVDLPGRGPRAGARNPRRPAGRQQGGHPRHGRPRRPDVVGRPGRRPPAHPGHQEAPGQQPVGDAGPRDRLLAPRPRGRRAGAGPGAVPATAGRLFRPDGAVVGRGPDCRVAVDARPGAAAERVPRLRRRRGGQAGEHGHHHPGVQAADHPGQPAGRSFR